MMVVLSEREQKGYRLHVAGVKRSYVPLAGEDCLVLMSHYPQGGFELISLASQWSV